VAAAYVVRSSAQHRLAKAGAMVKAFRPAVMTNWQSLLGVQAEVGVGLMAIDPARANELVGSTVMEQEPFQLRLAGI